MVSLDEMSRAGKRLGKRFSFATYDVCNKENFVEKVAYDA